MRLRNARQLAGHALRANDGVIGKVKDFYFDDRDWHIRYLVVETGKWLDSREVLISPVVLGEYDAARQVFPVDLTMEQVRNSPDIDTNKPVSRQREIELAQYYGWSGYWDGGFGGALIPPIVPPPISPDRARSGLTDGDRPPKRKEDPFLRSANDTIGYHLAAPDGEIGHVEDFLIDDGNWRIRYLVIDTRNWWPGKKVVVAPTWIAEVDWEKSRVVVDLTRDKIQSSPPYEPTTQWTEDYAAQLDEHYQRQ